MFLLNHYTVGISYACEDIDLVKKLEAALREKKISVFLDIDEKDFLVGRNLAYTLRDVFLNRCDYCLMFVSQSYVKKKWTNYERNILLEKQIKDHSVNPLADTVIPIKVDDTVLEGFSPDIIAFDIRTQSPEEIASIMLKKIDQKLEENSFSMEDVLNQMYSTLETFLSRQKVVLYNLQREVPWNIIVQLYTEKASYFVHLLSEQNLKGSLLKLYEGNQDPYKSTDIWDAEVYLQNNKLYMVNYNFIKILPGKPYPYTTEQLSNVLIDKFNVFIKEQQYV